MIQNKDFKRLKIWDAKFFVLKTWIQAAADLHPLVKEYISPNNINGSKFPKTDFRVVQQNPYSFGICFCFWNCYYIYIYMGQIPKTKKKLLLIVWYINHNGPLISIYPGKVTKLQNPDIQMQK